MTAKSAELRSLAERCRPAARVWADRTERAVLNDSLPPHYKPVLVAEADRARKLLDDIDAILNAAPQAVVPETAPAPEGMPGDHRPARQLERELAEALEHAEQADAESDHLRRLASRKDHWEAYCTLKRVNDDLSARLAGFESAPSAGRTTDERSDAASDRAYINGANFGWNCGVTGDRAKLDQAIAGREAELRAASSPSSGRRITVKEALEWASRHRLFGMSANDAADAMTDAARQLAPSASARIEGEDHG